MADSIKKNLVINRHTLWTIPNILTYIRILCVPVYMTLVILGARAAYPDWYVYLGLGIMVFASLTDVIDGKIARKYPSQGTYLGQCVDPIADKCMHIGAIVALSIAGYLHWAFIIFIVVRELCMVVIGTILVNDINIKSNMLGKVASALISVGIILSFFHPFMVPKAFGIDWMVVTLGLILNWAAAVNYAVNAIQQLRANKKEKAEGTAKAASDNEGTDTTEDNK